LKLKGRGGEGRGGEDELSKGAGRFGLHRLQQDSGGEFGHSSWGDTYALV
jgi:hypothetical protein